MTNTEPTGAIDLRLLLLEDSANDAELEVALLEDAGYACRWDRVQTRAAFLAHLDAGAYDCILSDFRLPDFDGLTALQIVRERGLLVPFILVSGALGEEQAIDSLKAGATDYVLKTRYQRLVPAVQRGLAEYAQARRHRETEAARSEEAEVSAALVRVATEVIASLDTPVLVRQLCQLTAQLLQCDCSHAFLVNPNGSVDAVMAGHEPSPGADAAAVERPAAAALAELFRCLGSEAMIELPTHVSPAGLLPPHLECTRSGVTLYVALRRAADNVGVLAASRARAEPFSSLQRRIAHGIAQLASLALANARVVHELEELNSLKTDFVNVMSHELRTPITIIMGYSDLLSDGSCGPLNPEQLEAVQRSALATRQLFDLLNTILDVGLLEAGALRVDLGTVDLRDLLGQIQTETAAARADKPDLAVRLHVTPAAQELRIDRAKLKAIIRKVVDNALKFTASGTVTVDAYPLDGGVEIAVTDTGIGIAPEVLPIIFQPFRQGERTLTRHYGGVGLGLYVARRLLEVLGGRITVASTPGAGSAFRIWVPSSGEPAARPLHGEAA